MKHNSTSNNEDLKIVNWENKLKEIEKNNRFQEQNTDRLQKIIDSCILLVSRILYQVSQKVNFLFRKMKHHQLPKNKFQTN